jgi:hypothetical protein
MICVNYKILYRHFVIALYRKTNVLFAFNADRKLVAGLLQDREEAELSRNAEGGEPSAGVQGVPAKTSFSFFSSRCRRRE